MSRYTELELAEGRHLPEGHGRFGKEAMAYYRKDQSYLHVNHDEILPLLHIGSVPSTRADFDHIRREGFDAVLDLCGDNDEEGEELRSRGMLFKRVRVHDTYSPTQDQFDEITKFLDGCAKSKAKVYVHCHAGAGRAPTAVLSWLIFSGHSVEEAVELVRRKRRVYFVSDRQMLGIRTLSNRLVPGRA